MDIGEAIALIGASAPVAVVVAHRVANSIGRTWMKMLADYKKVTEDRLVQGTEHFKRIDETLGLLLFLEATQSRRTEEIIRVAAPEEYARYVEPRLKKYGNGGT